MKRFFTLFAVLAVCVMVAQRAAAKHVVAYVTTWNSAMPDPSKVTHVNFAFGRINASRDGVMLVSEADKNRLRQIVALKQQNSNFHVLLSIGGGTESTDTWRVVADNADNRRKFAEDCLRVINEYGLDGVDIDWEYPNASDANFVSLIREIRQVIGNKLLTYASDPQGLFGNFSQTMQYFDFINVMAYDMGQCHSMLHPSAYLQSVGAAWYCTGEESARRHMDAGVPRNQLVFGMPFYAKNKYGDALTSREFISQVINSGNYTIGYDATACVGYALQGGQYLWCYESAQSLSDKCDYILDQGFLGGMYWELGQDDNQASLSTAVANKLIAAGGDDDVEVTVPSAPVPERQEDLVLSLLSDSYADNHGTSYANWWDGQAKQSVEQLADGDEAWKIDKFVFIGIEHDQMDVSNMKYLHMDVYPLATTASAVPAAAVTRLSVFPITKVGDNTDKYKELTLTPGQWNSFDMPVAEYAAMGLDMTQVYQLKLMGASGGVADGAGTFYLDNVYYWTDTPTGISRVEKAPVSDGRIYTLDGRTVDATKPLRPGIYISRGKKVVVK